MKFYNYKTIGFVFFLAIISSHKTIAQSTKKPNIIFIMTDDQSAVVPLDSEKRIQSRPFGFNGDKQVHTPIIDDLAKDGMIFNSAYVSSSVCVPSRYSMLTGRYAGRSLSCLKSKGIRFCLSRSLRQGSEKAIGSAS